MLDRAPTLPPPPPSYKPPSFGIPLSSFLVISLPSSLGPSPLPLNKNPSLKEIVLVMIENIHLGNLCF